MSGIYFILLLLVLILSLEDTCTVYNKRKIKQQTENKTKQKDEKEYDGVGSLVDGFRLLCSFVLLFVLFCSNSLL